MSLTPQQQATLQAFVLADPVFSLLPANNTSALQIANAMNEMADPDFFVWRSDISTYEVRDVLIWAEYDTLSVSKQNAFEFLCSNGIVNASRPNVRDGIASIFAGPNHANTRNVLIALAKRTSNKIEKLLATGTGSNASPATMGYEGTLRYLDVVFAMRWPY